jgi:hypothetical protein
LELYRTLRSDWSKALFVDHEREERTMRVALAILMVSGCAAYQPRLPLTEGGAKSVFGSLQEPWIAMRERFAIVLTPKNASLNLASHSDIIRPRPLSLI